jgi:quercetin dioxygenase-like cupin family protein
MEYIAHKEMKILSNPGVDSKQLLNPENSASTRVTITRVTVQPCAVQPRHTHATSEQIWIAERGNATLLLADDTERPFNEGDVARFADGDVHGLRNDSPAAFEYLSVTSPPINFGYAYAEKR